MFCKLPQLIPLLMRLIVAENIVFAEGNSILVDHHNRLEFF
jgi:hypothetical protein